MVTWCSRCLQAYRKRWRSRWTSKCTGLSISQSSRRASSWCSFFLFLFALSTLFYYWRLWPFPRFESVHGVCRAISIFSGARVLPGNWDTIAPGRRPSMTTKLLRHSSLNVWEHLMSVRQNHTLSRARSSSAIKSLNTSFPCAPWYVLDADAASGKVPICFVATIVSLAPAVSTRRHCQDRTPTLFGCLKLTTS